MYKLRRELSVQSWLSTLSIDQARSMVSPKILLCPGLCREDLDPHKHMMAERSSE